MILNDLSERQINWISLEGAELSETLRLENCSDAADDYAAFKVRTDQATGTEAKAKLYRVDENTAERQLQIWQAVEALRHPNLIHVLESGKKKVEQGELLYVVFETADEVLDRVLDERALDRNEAKEVFLSIIRALNALHANNLVHGAVSPSQIFATGDKIKLSVEPVRNRGQRALVRTVNAGYLAPENEQANTTPASDVWCLGATLYEAVTQRRAKTGIRVQDLAPPFDSVLARCFEADPARRGTLDEIFAIYESPERGAGGPRLHTGARIPASVDGDTSPVRRPLPKPLAKKTRLPAWIIGGIALVAAIWMIWLLWPGDRSKKIAQPARPSAPRVSARKEPPVARLAPANPSAVLPKDASSGAQDSASSGARHSGKSVWRVVVYTYSRLDDAQRKASSINERHPDLKAEAFSPDSKDGAGPYLVVVGGPATRQEAAQIRQQAAKYGMPRDSYVQNYNH